MQVTSSKQRQLKTWVQYFKLRERIVEMPILPILSILITFVKYFSYYVQENLEWAIEITISKW